MYVIGNSINFLFWGSYSLNTLAITNNGTINNLVKIYFCIIETLHSKFTGVRCLCQGTYAYVVLLIIAEFPSIRVVLFCIFHTICKSVFTVLSIECIIKFLNFCQVSMCEIGISG